MTRLVSTLALGMLLGCGKKPIDTAASNPEGSEEGVEVAPVLSPDQLVAAALEQLESSARSDWEKAAASLRQALSLEPGRLDAQMNLGVALQLLGDVVGARTQYETILAAHPDQERVWLYLGVVKESQGDSAGAVATYRQGLAQLPEAMPLHVALIGALRNQGRPADAIAASKTALGVNSNTIDVYNLSLIHI